MSTMHYCVLRIKTGHPIYEGRSSESAARYLVPGTCYGWGRSKEDARWHALSERQRFQHYKGARK